ncbi:MAG: SMP-30/gluconolactonase/LRE family protein [Chloroflexota bacterium]
MRSRVSIPTRVMRVAAVGALIAAASAPGAGAAGPRATAPSSGADAVRIFASAPAPGHPFGIAVGDGRVYVSTSAGDFFADPANGGHRNSDDERVFTYTEDGTLVDTTVIDTADNSDMGLFGLALDGNAGPKHQLFVGDMNGRILTVGLGAHAGPPKLFSQVPVDSGLAGDWMLSMWNDLTFDRTGNLYVPDDKPRIWRVAPDGTARIWFTDPRLTGLFGFAGGPLGGRIDPTGQWLYISITIAAEFAPSPDSTIYRIRLVDHPTAADMELVHRFVAVPDPTVAPPQATGLAFSKAGNLYVSLLGPNEIAVLDPAGDEIRRIADPRFHSPWGLAFLGNKLLVTNGDLEPGDNPDAWKIFEVSVGETGLPLNRPRVPVN